VSALRPQEPSDGRTVASGLLVARGRLSRSVTVLVLTVGHARSINGPFDIIYTYLRDIRNIAMTFEADDVYSMNAVELEVDMNALAQSGHCRWRQIGAHTHTQRTSRRSNKHLSV